MDPVQTSIMVNRFNAIVEEASSTLYRTAHTTFVKLVQDFQCALATPDGEVFAYPSHSGVTSFIGLSVKGGLAGIDMASLRPGDCIVTNDPFTTDGMVTHMMDVSLVRPIFRDGRLIALSWAFVHASDIGGAVPGSISPSLTETFQEGLRLRPVKLYENGVLNTSIKNILLDNSRISAELWGDMQAMYSAMKSMDLRLNQLCDRYDADTVCQAMEAALSLAEIRSREVIRAIPDGEYPFSDYIEGMKDGEFIHVHANMVVSGDELTIDFTGTDPQIAAAFNFVTGDHTNPYALQSLIYFILTNAPDAPRNRGLLRPIRIIAPRGTVINADYPAAGGSRVTASTCVYNVILGCLNKAVPEGITASGPGMSGIIVLTARDPIGGGRRVSVINPLCGGGGGRRGHHGADGVDSRSGSLLTVPFEVIEVETVMRVRRYGMITDSQAAGQWRGGAAIVLELENTDLDATMTVRGMNRFHFAPWGARGGDPGILGSVVFNPDKPEQRDIGKIDVLHFRRGDVVRLTTPAGGGFGDPAERDAEEVARDVELGLLSREKALRSYGVVLSEDGALDARATMERRARMPRRTALFSMGQVRDDFDRIWPTPARKALAKGVFAYDRAIRSELVRRTVSWFLSQNITAEIGRVEDVLLEQSRELND